MAPVPLGEEQKGFCWECTIFSRHEAARPVAGTVLHCSRLCLCGPDPFVPHLSFLFLLLPFLPHLAGPSHLWMSFPCQCCGPVVTQTQPHTTDTWMWLTKSPPSPTGHVSSSWTPESTPDALPLPSSLHFNYRLRVASWASGHYLPWFCLINLWPWNS